MFSADVGWLFFAYLTGTLVGWWFAYTSSLETVIANTIDSLVKEGYLKSRTNEEGEEEIIKWDE